MSEPRSEGFKEKSDKRNIRYICYSLLGQVSYAGEPVVPKILSEGKDEFLGKYFEVEELEGEDLSQYLLDASQPKMQKLKVLLHITRQLQAIDDAGYIIFDRGGLNIRVLSHNPEHISTRQIDIEDMYDKHADAVYSLRDSSMSEELADSMKENDLPLWAIAVHQLALFGEVIGETHKDPALVKIFSRYRKNFGEPGHTLEEIEEACVQVLSKED